MKLIQLDVLALAAAFLVATAADAQEPPVPDVEPPAAAAPDDAATAAAPEGDATTTSTTSTTSTTATATAPATDTPAAPSAPPAAAPRDDAPAAAGTSGLNAVGADVQVALHAELGLLWPVAHTIQFGQDGTRIDYVAQGGQDTLFPFARLSADVAFLQRHVVTLLYQPLQLVSTQTAREELRVFDTRYAEGTPVRFTYGFDFWRLSYLYDFNDAPETELALGASLQIRNAAILVEAVDGSQANYLRNIGPVPVIKGRVRHDLGRVFWVGAEADGFYAPIRYLNGGDVDVVGAVLDASVRGGVHLGAGVDTFLNLRYFGGGSSGTNNNSREPGDGFTDNWLHFVSLSLGFTLR